MELIKKTFCRTAALCLLIALGYLILSAGGYIRLGDSVDAVSSATGEIISADQVDGSFVVLLNRQLHDESGTTADWLAFLRGESPIIMEDIVCAVGDTDSAALELAESYRSRLPENQMKIKTEQTAMLISKTENGVFDLVIMSREAVKANAAGQIFERLNPIYIEE